MFQLINSILLDFLSCFKRIKTWQWFVVLTIGFMVRQGSRGVTQTISALRLDPKLYHTMLHFFRSSGYKVSDLYSKWIQIAQGRANLVHIAGRVLLLGDHIKMPKEGRRMPGVQILHQESQNSKKPEYIEGHTLGHISAVISSGKVSRSLPLISQRQESPPRIEGTNKPDGDTIVVQLVDLAVTAAKSFIDKKAIIALDAYFAKASAFETAAKALTNTGERLLEIVTRAPTDTVAYTVPVPPLKRKRGNPRIYGDKIVLYDLFDDMSCFTQTTMVLYGKETKVAYRCLDLIWKPTKELGLIRFVIVALNGSEHCVLMSSSLELSPEEIITAYGLRFKIEHSFNEQKNDMGCFSYHFWTTALPKRKKWKKAKQPDDAKSQALIEGAKRAIESFICLGTIATGILTIIAFTHNREIWKRYPGWIKTLRGVIPSVAVVKETIAHDLPLFLEFYSHLPICSIIKHRRRAVEFLFDEVA